MLYETDLHEELELSAEQLKKLVAVLRESPASRDLYTLAAEDTHAWTFTSDKPKMMPKTGGGTLVLKGSSTHADSTTGKSGSGSGGSTHGPMLTSGAVGVTPQGGIKAKQPELQQKAEELEKQFRQQLRAAFTSRQLAALKQIALRKAIGRSLRDPKTLETLGLSEQQKAELGRLREERAWIRPQLCRKVGQQFLKQLTPRQRQKLVEELDRRQWLNL